MENNLQVQTYNMDLNGTNSTGIVIMECEPSTSQTLPGASNSKKFMDLFKICSNLINVYKLTII